MGRTRRDKRSANTVQPPVAPIPIPPPLPGVQADGPNPLIWLRVLPMLGLALCGIANACAYKLDAIGRFLVSCGLAEAADVPAGRFFPMLSGDVLLLALPLVTLPWLRLRGEPAVRAWAWWWIAGACAFLDWQALVDTVQPTVPAIAWAHFGNRCMLVCAAAAVLVARPGAAGLLRLLGLGSALSIGFYALPHIWPLISGRIDNFIDLNHGNAIYGNVSWIVNASAPGILAMVALRSAERQAERPLPPWAMLGLVTVATLALSGIVTQRFSTTGQPPRWLLVMLLMGWIAAAVVLLGYLRQWWGRGMAAGMWVVFGVAIALLVCVSAITVQRLRGWPGLPQWGFMAIGLGWALAMAWWWGLGRGGRSGSRCWEGWTILLGLELLLVVSIPTGRRGFLLFLVLITGWLAWDWLRQRRPRLAWWGLGIGLALLVAVGLGLLMGTDLMRHEVRAMQARAAIEAAGKVFPWGWGGYPALQFHDSAPDCGDYIITWMKLHDHVHNEVLEVLLQAGWIGLAGVAALVGWLAVRVCNLTDPVLRTGVLVACVGVLVPISTDNTIFTTMGACVIGAIIGLALRASATADPFEAGAAVPSPSPARWWRLALIPAVLFAAHTARNSAVVAGLSTTITEERPVLDGISNAKDVYIAKQLSNVGLIAAGRANRFDIGKQVIAAMDARLGPADPRLPRVPWGLEPFNYILESTKDPDERADACIRCVSCYPFEDKFYQELDTLRNQRQEIAARIPPAVRRRLDWWYRPTAAEPIDLTRTPRTVGEATDQYVRLRALIFRHDGDPAPVADAIEHLLQRYRLIPNLTKLALEAVIALPDREAEIVAARAMKWPLQGPDADSMAQFLSQLVSATAPAKRMHPILERMYFEPMSQARRVAAGEKFDEVSPLVAMLVKTIGLCGGVTTLPAPVKP